jgi:hypothetical protein
VANALRLALGGRRRSKRSEGTNVGNGGMLISCPFVSLPESAVAFEIVSKRYGY